MSGRWKALKGIYFPKYLEAEGLAGKFPRLRFRLLEGGEGPAYELARKAYGEWLSRQNEGNADR